jgi:histidinol-phosphate aminotransferase
MRWQLPPSTAVVHGSSDAGPAVRWDFSSNANAAGPLGVVADAVAAAPRDRYPDPDYTLLRMRLAQWHGVSPERVLPAGSASEFIRRFTSLAAQCGRARRVHVPAPGYADYAAAAAAALRPVQPYPPGDLPMLDHGDLWWITEPHSPSGATQLDTLAQRIAMATTAGADLVLDLAYQPLRFDGFALPNAVDHAWQLWSPNKAAGLTGVRGAFAIAPAGGEDIARALRALAPSWVLGADGVALLSSFASMPAQQQLHAQRESLRGWREILRSGLLAAGWRLAPERSVTPFFCARPPGPAGLAARWHAHWRRHGLKLRDATSFGLPGWVRVAALPPEATQALAHACRTFEFAP